MATTISVIFLLFSFLTVLAHAGESSEQYPLVVSTWPFLDAVRAAWRAADGGSSAVDAVVEGCSACEELRCDGTVGPGGSPDENGETTIDALVMNGTTMEVGAVAAMRFVKDGIRAAKLVMEHTEHTLLVGEQASVFAISMGLPGPSNLSSSESMTKWVKWKENHCQPNFRKNVIHMNNCGPYRPSDTSSTVPENSCGSDSKPLRLYASSSNCISRNNHDTISMAVIDKAGHIAVGTSTNGATFKIPGRVGDGPIVGSSAYADDEVGACGATGDGDIMMRFLPCLTSSKPDHGSSNEPGLVIPNLSNVLDFIKEASPSIYQVVESMRLGMDPKRAAADAISRIARKFPNFIGAVFALNKNGVHAGACHGWTFQYSLRNSKMDDVQIFTVSP